MGSMRAAEITTFGGPEVLQACERERPTPAKDEVLIRVQAAGVNRPDVLQRMGLYPPPKGISDLPGLEVAGVVESTGAEATRYSQGDWVTALIAGGGYAEYAVAPEPQVLPVPAGLSFEEAAGIPECFFTVWSNLFERAYLGEGESLLVHGGSSGIGTTAIQLAKAFGVEVFVTAGSDEKCAFCLELGADHAINYKTQDFVAEVLAATGDKGVDVILDMVGGDYVQRDLNCLGVAGRLVIIAFLGGTSATIDLRKILTHRLTITGSGLRLRDVAFKGAVANQLEALVWPLIEAGKVRPVVDRVFPLEAAGEAHAYMEAGKHKGKIILEVSED